jgi:DNA-binding NtrC family response regulator
MLPVILRRYGFNVTVAAMVREALDAIQKQDFELLLCDLNIERDGDGYDVVRAIRERNPDCVVIILTGYPAMESAIEGIHLKVDDYMVKPSNADALVALLGERLARQAKSTPKTQPRSAITKSGSSCLAFSIASWPFSASPHT